jgi:hypothetical protein
VQRTGVFIAERLEQLAGARASARETCATPPAAVFAPRPAPLELATALLAKRPSLVRGSPRYGKPVRAARHVLGRLLWPYIAEQQELNSSIVDTLRALDDRQRVQDERFDAVVSNQELERAANQNDVTKRV